MAETLPRQAESADSVSVSSSLKRMFQLTEALEATADAVMGRGVLSGGVVTQQAVFTARIPTGTVFVSSGYTYTLTANVDTSGLAPAATNYLWAAIERTPADETLPTALDTYALDTAANTTGTAPSADHTLVAILTTDGSGILSINNDPAGKYVAGHTRQQDAIGAAPVLTAAAEASNARLVSIQARDAAGNNLAERRLLRILISDTQYGAEAATAPSGGVAVTAGRLVQTVTAGKQFLVEADATGLAQVTLTEAGAVSFWVTAWMDSRAGSVEVAFV